MRVIFVGSLEANLSYLDIVRENLQALVKLMAKSGFKFLLRDVPADNKSRIPIDHFVCQALEELTKSSVSLDSDAILVCKEPGVSGYITPSMPFICHSATTSFRLDFYRELLELTDLVLGIGGELGLIRIAILAEWTMKPLFVLPGSGGTSDILWSDFFKKSHQLIFLKDEDLLEIKRMPYINEKNSHYAEAAFDIIKKFHLLVSKGARKRLEIISPTTVSLRTFIINAKRFSLAMWAFIIGIASALCSISYYIGKYFSK